MASDARVRYTKMVIIQNFIKLLKEKPVSKITVKEICELAELNRATFYKHYLDVFDLLDKIESQFIEELLSVLHSRENKTAKDMAWVGTMNNLRNAAEEVINTELIYA